VNNLELKIKRLEKYNGTLLNENKCLRHTIEVVEEKGRQSHRELNKALQKYHEEKRGREELEFQLRSERDRNCSLKKQITQWEDKWRKISMNLECMQEQGKALKKAQARIKDLEKKLNIRKGIEDPYGINTPSSRKVFKSNSTEENFAKRGGAVNGHKGHGWKSFSKEEADEIRHHKGIFSKPCCTAPDLREIGIESHSHIDFVPMKLKVVYDENKVVQCAHCGAKFSSPIPDTLPGAKYSNRAVAMMAQEAYFHQVPIGYAARRFKVNKGTYIGIMHRVANFLFPLYLHLLNEIKECVFVHADETSWSIDGKSGYAWLFANDIFKIFQFRDTRSSQVPLSVFGQDNSDIIIVRDRYCGYNALKTKHQYCFVHIVRDLKNLTTEFPDDPEVKRFRSDLMPLLKRSIKLTKKSRPPPDQYKLKAEKLKMDIMTICRQQANHPGVQKFQNIFRENEDRLFQWVTYPGVPCENNHAERNLRPVVISRKLSFGCQSERGMKTREIIMSVLHTVGCRGIDAQVFLETILNAICQDPNSDVVRIFTDFQNLA